MKTKKVIYIKSFNNFNSTTDVKTTGFYNFLPTTNLKSGKGVAIATFPKNLTDKTEKPLNISKAGVTSVEGVAYFKQLSKRNNKYYHRLIIYGDDKKVYINQMMDDTYDLFWLYEMMFNSPPIALCFKKDDEDAIILASQDSMKIWKTDYSPYTISGVPVITSMCMNDGVLFCSINNPAYKIWYATDLNPENVGNISSNSGYISLVDDLGDAKKVLAFQGEVFVFREYGISKITFIKNEALVSQIYASNAKIYPNTVSVCGNFIVFATNDGLYSFNGYKVNRLDVEILNTLQFENENAVSASLGEKYYMALNIKFDDENRILCEQEEYVNNALLVVNTVNLTYEIVRGVDIKYLLPLKTNMFEKMLVTFNSGNNHLLGQIVETSKCIEDSLPKFWASDSLTDNFNTKLFTKLIVDADIGVEFTLKANDETIKFITEKQGVSVFNFKFLCTDLKLEISSSNEKTFVNNVRVEYYEY